MIRKCKLCGLEFDAKGRKFICDREHYNICKFCGKKFEVNSSNYTNLTCSPECRSKLAIKNRKPATTRKLTNETSIGKYERTCKLCGKTFRTNGSKRDVCYDEHRLSCSICGKEYVVCPPKLEYKRTCSTACAARLRIKECELKYGVRSTLQLPDVKEKVKQTNLKRYGVENPLSSPKIRTKIKETCLKKYGVEFATQSKEMQSKSRQTCIERYGVDIAAKSEGVQNRIKQTCIERYGVDNIFKSTEFRKYVKDLMQDRYNVDYYTQTSEFKAKQKATWEEKYGGNPWSCSEVRAKCNETNLKLYGDIWPQRNKEIRKQQLDSYIHNRANRMVDPTARANYLEFKSNPQKYIQDHCVSDIQIADVAKQLGYADPTLLYSSIHEYKLDSVLRRSGISKMEQEVYDFIQSLDSDIEIKLHDRVEIYPKEIDLYLPKYHLGIECNATITHNSTYVLANALGDLNSPVTPKDYHAIKSQMCQDKGIFLFHIFGYEWTNHKDVILSMIRNLLNKNQNKYYARNLQVREVSLEDSLVFLESNHRQGSAFSSIRLGLYDDSNLLSLMTFGNIRPTIGHTLDDVPGSVELIRFCNKRNTSVVGGASKLFKYFIRTYKPIKVISFSDRAHTKGSLYNTLGFKVVRTSNPGYVWVNLLTDLYLNRVTCQKSNLPKLFNEPDLDIKNQTEQQIMSSKGFVQVFDSGTIRWEYSN